MATAIIADPPDKDTLAALLKRLGGKPKSRMAEVYRAPKEKVLLGKDGILDGEAVLPGFKLPLPELFASISRRKRR